MAVVSKLTQKQAKIVRGLFSDFFIELNHAVAWGPSATYERVNFLIDQIDLARRLLGYRSEEKLARDAEFEME